VTIHRDLDQPAAEHCVRKIHGGATILSSVVFEGTFNCRARRLQEEKRALAAHIASLIEPEMTVISDDRTTTAAPAEFLHAREPLAIAANAESLVSSPIRHEEISVICIGGHYNVVTDVFLGVDCEMVLERQRVDLSVFSAAASRGGAYLLECELTRAKIAMKAAAELSFLARDHTKFGKLALHLFGWRKEFDCITTTEIADQAEIDRLRTSEVPIDAAFDDSVGRMLQ
jgi:DeoR/GlpR family transcriptional regulator of sugar metabolism